MNRGLIAMLALLAGAGLAVQVGLNSTLKDRVGHAIHAALISFASGTAALAFMAWFVRDQARSPSEVVRGPWWMWLGGMVGVVYVTLSAALAVRLGSAPWLALVIAGQLFAALVLDHFGLVGFDTHPVNAGRVAGVVLLLAGVYLVLRS